MAVTVDPQDLPDSDSDLAWYDECENYWGTIYSDEVGTEPDFASCDKKALYHCTTCDTKLCGWCRREHSIGWGHDGVMVPVSKGRTRCQRAC